MQELSARSDRDVNKKENGFTKGRNSPERSDRTVPVEPKVDEYIEAFPNECSAMNVQGNSDGGQ
jgi:hypothetical protein